MVEPVETGLVVRCPGKVLDMSVSSNLAPSQAVRWTKALEEAAFLDGAVRAVEPVVRNAFGTGARGEVLRGDWLGHALHPVLTDVTLGVWTSATLLDLVGGREARGAAQTLVAAGLATAGPTAWTGWAQWVEAGPRDQRVGLVHAVTVATSIGAYGASWLARRRGDHAKGVALGLAGAAVAGVGGYLGSHLLATRHVATHDPAFD